MKKRIVLLTHFYPPEPCAAANRAQSLVRALLTEGNDVTVVTSFPSFPSRCLQAGDAWRFSRLEETDGARVVRLFTATLRGLPGARLLHWVCSALAASVFLLTTRRRFDSIIVTMPPITLALPALVGSIRHGAKLVVDVRDVYPDIAIAMGEWREGSFLARATEWVARLLYRRAALVTAVTPTALRQIGSRGVPENRLLLAPNGCEAPESRPPARVREDCKFVALYAGNLGLASDLDVLLDAANLLRADERIELWIAGDGVEGDRVRKRVADEHLVNVQLLGALSRAAAMQTTADADIALVPLRKGIGESIPTKIFDALSVGCPVLVAAEGEARNTALASRGGIVISPGDARALAKALSRLAALNKNTLRASGERGRSYVVKFYLRDTIMMGYSRRIAALMQP
ncbi:MAG: glycosyltransferase family 4 protein [Candidatus Aquilonibacter sp.]